MPSSCARTTATVYNFHLKLPIKYIFGWFRYALSLLTHFRTFPNEFEVEKKGSNMAKKRHKEQERNKPRSNNHGGASVYLFDVFVLVWVHKLRRTTLLMENCWNSTSTATTIYSDSAFFHRSRSWIFFFLLCYLFDGNWKSKECTPSVQMTWRASEKKCDALAIGLIMWCEDVGWYAYRRTQSETASGLLLLLPLQHFILSSLFFFSADYTEFACARVFNDLRFIFSLL